MPQVEILVMVMEIARLLMFVLAIQDFQVLNVKQEYALVTLIHFLAFVADMAHALVQISAHVHLVIQEKNARFLFALVLQPLTPLFVVDKVHVF